MGQGLKKENTARGDGGDLKAKLRQEEKKVGDAAARKDKTFFQPGHSPLQSLTTVSAPEWFYKLNETFLKWNNKKPDDGQREKKKDRLLC